MNSLLVVSKTVRLSIGCLYATDRSLCALVAGIMFLISWAFTIVSLALASLLYWYVSIKGKGGDWGDGFKSAYFQLALRSLRSLGGWLSFNALSIQ